jgi:hypothetical protein
LKRETRKSRPIENRSNIVNKEVDDALNEVEDACKKDVYWITHTLALMIIVYVMIMVILVVS